MKSIKSKLAILFSLLVFNFGVLAQFDTEPGNFCRNGSFPRQSLDYKIARIKGAKGEKIYFYGDDREDCPGGQNCRLKSYVIPGDEVIVSRTLGNFACSWYQPRKGSETVGWIETGKLEWVETVRNPAVNAWLGEWRHYDNSIRISKSKTTGFFDVKGNAFWKGLGDNIHIGELDHQAKPTENALKFGEPETEQYGCRVMMFLVGKFLIVSDNLQCGGANVSFSGVYLKRAKK